MAAAAGRLAKGLGALILLALLLVGLPVALWTVGGSPLPDAVPSWNQVVSTLTHPDVTGSVLLGTVKIVAWAGWATFALAVVVEIPAALRGVPTPRLRGLGMQQRAAAVLVIAVITMGSSGMTGMGGAAHAADAQASVPVVSATATASTMVPLVPGQGGLVDAQVVEAQLVSTAHAEQADREVTTTKAETHELATYEVQRGDNLWQIAEDRLGDGNRYSEIVELNVGVTQADGYALEPGSDWIEPGWVLTLPIAAETAPGGDQPAEDHDHVVRPGESLSSIAQDHLGEADRYPELFDASRDTVQPDGDQLTDPSLIRPGWVVTVPGEDVAQEAPAAVQHAVPVDRDVPDIDLPVLDAPAPVQPVEAPVAMVPGFGATSGGETAQDGWGAVGQPGGAVSGGAESQVPAAAADGVQDADDAVVDTRTAAGIGGLLAAGLLGLLAGRRLEARRQRRAGQRLALPAADSEVSSFEAEIRAVGEPLARETVDVALRALAAWHRDHGRPLPEVRVARFASHTFELYLDHPADLPAPWESTADRQVWRLDAESVDAATVEASRSGEAPWPALVTIGHDDEDAHVLLDLERAGCLDIRGDQEIGRAALAALAVELATSVWADDLQVTLVGAHANLPGVVDTGRVRHVTELASIVRELEARADDVRTVLRQVDADSLGDARGRGLATDAWTPEILLVGEQLDDALRSRLERLVDQVPGVGIAAVTTGDRRGEWTLDLADAGTGRGVLYPAQIAVRPQQLDPTSYALAVALLARSEPEPGPAWAQHLTDDEVPLSQIPVPDAVVDDVEDDDAPTLARVATLRPPLLRVLGPVTMEVASGITLPGIEARRATELVAYLAFHPGAGEDELRAALWPTRRHGTKEVRGLVSRARRWLGTDADGREHLPRTDASGFRLHGVDTDWSRFLGLVGEDVTAVRTDRLLTALDLVRGPVFQGIPPRGYAWAQPIWEELTASVVDVAHEVARRALTTGDIATALQASEVGRVADPLDERAWRDAIRAEWAAGRLEQVDVLVAALRDRVEAAGLDLGAETEDLVAQVRRGPVPQRPGDRVLGA
jgi:nucleoid-associated protein YgaU/DNA-binding SARP family transcriptional activator